MQDRIARANRETRFHQNWWLILSRRRSDSVLTMDLHAAQIQGFFDIPVNHLEGMSILAKHFEDEHLDDLVIVSPDFGSVTKSKKFCRQT